MGYGIDPHPELPWAEQPCPAPCRLVKEICACSNAFICRDRPSAVSPKCQSRCWCSQWLAYTGHFKGSHLGMTDGQTCCPTREGIARSLVLHIVSTDMLLLSKRTHGRRITVSVIFQEKLIRSSRLKVHPMWWKRFLGDGTLTRISSYQSCSPRLTGMRSLENSAPHRRFSHVVWGRIVDTDPVLSITGSNC